MKNAPKLPNKDRFDSILKSIRDEDLEIGEILEIFNAAGAVLNRVRDEQTKMVLFRQLHRGGLKNDLLQCIAD